RNDQAVIANNVEVYGRERVVDAHREPSVVRKGAPVVNSLPPLKKTPYKNVWPATIPLVEHNASYKESRTGKSKLRAKSPVMIE
ncbi:hypothetical protein BGZ50_009475, partial [Haplosporangium sp. Z 11]